LAILWLSTCYINNLISFSQEGDRLSGSLVENSSDSPLGAKRKKIKDKHQEKKAPNGFQL